MGSKPNKPLHSVVDLGLRDVGVKNEPRRLAAYLGKWLVPLFALVVLSVVALCAVVITTEVAAWTVAAVFVLVWTVGGFLLAVRISRRAPPLVVKITAEGANQATWLVIVPSLLLALPALLIGEALAIPLLALTVIVALLVWRGRGLVPEMLRRLRPLLATGETVLGDGIGVARGRRNRRDALRLVVATDRRLLVAGSSRSPERFLLVDVPYRLVSRFGIEWKRVVNTGALSLTVPGVEGAEAETHVIDSVAPGNLLSIARALESHGVETDDPAAVAEAVSAWEEGPSPREPRERLLDRGAMSTREFDRGLWLLLGLAAVTFYLNPFGVRLWGSSAAEVPLLVAVLGLCAACGYVAGTRSSLAYIAPLNLLVTPAFFFADALDVITTMVVLSALAVLGLWAGSALRRRTDGRVSAGRGLRLIRISGVMLAVMVTLVGVASAAGFELITLRLAVEEVTAKQLPVDGRSNLNGNAASLTYTRGPDLREFITDEDWGAGPNDGARWELRSSFTKGYNVISLAHYIFVEPRLDDEAAVADFVAGKDDEHSRTAGYRVKHRERVVDGRRGYVWNHRDRQGEWLYSAWFPHPVHSVRLECVARRQADRFKRLCAEATKSLKFH